MDPQTLLTLWERGRHRHPLDRAVMLLAMAAPEHDAGTLADRTLGERNAALLRFRRELSGDRLESSVDCPECGERLEFVLSAATLLARGASPASHVQQGGVRVRVPTTRDLASIAGEEDEDRAARRLLARLCEDGDAHTLETAELDAILQALDEADPCADIALEVACPACAYHWSAPFDIAAFLWDEIDVRARRLLDEVHVLARAYAWPEADILRLSDARRQAYLERALA